MPALQTRIFVLPATNEFMGENVAGRIIGPLVAAFPQISAFWFSRYGQNTQDSAVDSNLANIPPQFSNNGNYFSVRFRFWVSDEAEQEVRTSLSELVTQNEFWIHDIRAYDDGSDLANDRFLEGAQTPERQTVRRDLMQNFLHASARLFIDMLERQPDGNFRLTHNGNGQNPHGSTFESVHHLFCNMTNVPTHVLVGATTRMYQQQGIPLGEIRVRF